MEGQARQPAARDAQPLLAADCRARDDGARRARSRSSPASPTTCSASTSPAASCSGRSDTRARSRPPTRRSTTRSASAVRRRCRRWNRSRRAKHTIYAIAWDGRLHQINAADGPTSPLPTSSCRPTASRPERRQRRRLHGDGAGLRRRSERALLAPSGDSQGEHVPPGRRRHVGPAGRGDFARRRRLHGDRRRDVQPADEEPRQRHRRRQARRQPAAAAGRLLRAAERQLDARAIST